MELVLQDLVCGYEKNILFKNLNCTFRTGEAVAVLGANGIGKSSVMKAILRRQTLLGGRVLIDQKNMADFTLRQLAEYVSYVPQTKDCNYNFSVAEVIMMGRAAYLSVFSSPGAKEYDKALEILNILGMEKYAERNYNMLSGGEQQMVLIARAMIQDSKFILMDEPASNLDYLNQKVLLKTIMELKKQDKGIILITHSPEHALLVCEKVFVIESNGKYIYGDTNELLSTEMLCKTYNTTMRIITEISEDGKRNKACCLEI